MNDADVGPGASADRGAEAPLAVREWWWVTARRVSGLALLVVLPVHLALTRVFADPADATVPVVRARWSTPGWRLLEVVLLVAVAVHVVATVRVTVAGSRLGASARTAVVAVTAAAAVAVAGFGTAVLLSFPW